MDPAALPRLERPARFVGLFCGRPDRDEDQPLGARCDLPRGPRIHMHEPPDLQRHRRVVDAHRPTAAYDDVDLLLPGRLLVVLRALEPRLEDELVDPERPGAQLATHKPHGAARPGWFDLLHVNDTVTHAFSLPERITFAHGSHHFLLCAAHPPLARDRLPDRDPGPVLPGRS